MSTRQSPLLVTADLARSDASGLPSQAFPLADAGRADPQRLRDRSNRLACISTRQSALADILRIGPAHPCWPPFPSRILESETSTSGNPDSDQKQHALVLIAIPRDLGCWRESRPAVGATN